MDYFYTPPGLVHRGELLIEGEEFAHLSHVMRKKAGDTVRVVDGQGNAYDVTILEISRQTARCAINQTHTRLNEAGIEVTLGVGLLKNASRFDFLVEKATELGVMSVVPLLTERTIGHHAKVERWHKLALAAMKQSGRSVLPRVQVPQHLPDFLGSVSAAMLRLLPDEKQERPLLTDVLGGRTLHSVVICIGPEGGFSPHEVSHATSAGFTPVSLGPRRLRTETAALVAVASVLTR